MGYCIIVPEGRTVGYFGCICIPFSFWNLFPTVLLMKCGKEYRNSKTSPHWSNINYAVTTRVPCVNKLVCSSESDTIFCLWVKITQNDTGKISRNEWNFRQSNMINPWLILSKACGINTYVASITRHICNITFSFCWPWTYIQIPPLQNRSFKEP